MHSNTYTASAAKRGRFASKPYVPVVVHLYKGPAIANPDGRRTTQQIRPYAFATREEAIRYAEKYIDANHLERG